MIRRRYTAAPRLAQSPEIGNRFRDNDMRKNNGLKPVA